ncbi:MAG TPA: cobalamin biosynthesis protein [Acidocella sp.]|uniref:cobalamin biosynthesis protein n=1 Tax=Acidocella sp. TaxID=50710 RepID=UPI002B735071|nr:cobalamin biosynthesis protein [Acidocella sp.]HVE22780.1 cobalamin biosynthesis protein [Acidocella sp.]
MIVAGVGFSSGAAAAEIVALVRRAESLAGHAAEILAAPDFKEDAACLREAVQTLGLPLRLVDRAALAAAQENCPTQSEVAAQVVGLGSVAEACALAGAGEKSHLLVARLTQGNVTCALAGDLP